MWNYFLCSVRIYKRSIKYVKGLQTSRPLPSELSDNKQRSNMVLNRFFLASTLSNTLPAPLDDLWPTLQHHERVDPLVCSENKQFHQALESERKKPTNTKLQQLG